MTDSMRLAEAQARLHRLWTDQLYREYDNLLYQYRLPLRPAVLRVEALGRRWGMWDPGLRTITLSCALIQDHPWDVVLEVLKHEVAHQVVSEMFCLREQHGPGFQRACKLLGVADWAAHASGALPEEIVPWHRRALSPQDERLLKRVEKLLSLATSSNEHEALSAMRRVRELYARHNVQHLQRGDADSALTYCMLGQRKKRIDRAESMIFALLVDHFFVRAIFGRQYDAADCCEYRVVEILGSRHNVLMAEYVYHFLLRQLEVLWQAYRSTRGQPGARQSYMCGILAGFGDKLRRDSMYPQETVAGMLGTSDRALVRIADAQLDAFVSARHPRLGVRSMRGGGGDAASYQAGMQAGQKLVLHKGLTGPVAQRGRLLGSG